MNSVTSGCFFESDGPLQEWLDVGEEPEPPRSMMFRGSNGFSGCSAGSTGSTGRGLKLEIR